MPEKREKRASDKSESGIGAVFSWLFHQNAGFFGKGEVGVRQRVEGCLDGPGADHHHDVPAGTELFLIQAVYFPDAAAGTVADVGLAQLFADGNAHPVGVRAVFPGIEYQIPVCLSAGPVQPLKDVVEFE